jgi:hypothetical protein
MSKEKREESIVEVKVKDPEIPSNIVWESRRWGSEEDICNRIMTFIGLTMLMVAVWGFIVLTRYQT